VRVITLHVDEEYKKNKRREAKKENNKRKGGEKKLTKMYSLYLLLLLWLLSLKEKNSLIDGFLQHPVGESMMIIAICLPIIYSQNNIVSIAFFNQRHHHHMIYLLNSCHQS